MYQGQRPTEDQFKISEEEKNNKLTKFKIFS